MKLLEAATYILEMSYQRKRAIDLIGNQASELANHMVMVQHAPNSLPANHWKTEINSFISNIHDATFLKNKKRLKRDDIHELVFSEPLGEYEDYTRRLNRAAKTKTEVAFSNHSEEHYADLRRKYKNLVDALTTKDTPTYEQIASLVYSGSAK